MTQTGAIARTHQPIVFVIDDDASVHEAVEDLLRSVGLKVESFASTQEFFGSKRPDAPGCIVLDVRLPGSSGLEFQRTLMKSRVLLPVIFISGHGDISMSVQAIKAGAIDFLTKPLHEQKLLDAIQTGIERDRDRRAMTVKIHRSQMMRKMRAKSLVNLVRMADMLKVSSRDSQAT